MSEDFAVAVKPFYHSPAVYPTFPAMNDSFDSNSVHSCSDDQMKAMRRHHVFMDTEEGQSSTDSSSTVDSLRLMGNQQAVDFPPEVLEEPIEYMVPIMVNLRPLNCLDQRAEDDRLSVGSRTSRTSSVGSDYNFGQENGIPKAPPLPDSEHCAMSVTRRSSNESTDSNQSLTSFGRRRHSHPIYDFTHKIQDKAKKILGKIGHLSAEEHEVLEYYVQKEEVLPIDPVEAEQTRNIIETFLNEGQVIATTEIEVLEELEQTSSSDAFDGARQEYASLVATANEALHDFQDPENIAQILSSDTEECQSTAAKSGNELFVKHFLAEHGRSASLVEGDSEDATGKNGENPCPVEQKSFQDPEAPTAAKPSSPLITYRYNVDSPYKRLR